MKFSVTVTLKKDVLDPQGKVVQNTLQNLGMDSLKNVKFEETRHHNPKKKNDIINVDWSRTKPPSHTNGNAAVLLKSAMLYCSHIQLFVN